MTVEVQYALRRVSCRRCGGVRAEQVPWAAHGSWFTSAFEELVAYYAQTMNRTAVTKLLGVSWSAVGNIITRVVNRTLDENRLHGIRRIGIDEFSYKKRHHYLTLVVDHDTRRVVWAGEGRGSETLKEFFRLLGPEGVARLELATIDMAGGYIKALKEGAPHVKVIFDRFHVQKLASDAVEEVRRALWQRLRGGPIAPEMKGLRFILLKNGSDLSRKEHNKLRHLRALNSDLYTAYLLKESLREAYAYRQPKQAKEVLEAWVMMAKDSGLAAFTRVARTVEHHWDGILGYFEGRITNALTEGLNNKLRAIARRSFGFHSASSLTAMVYLCMGGIRLDPPLPLPTQP